MSDEFKLSAADIAAIERIVQNATAAWRAQVLGTRAALPREDGWMPIETHDGSTDPVLVVSREDGWVGEAEWHEDDGWWWANNDPTDAWGSRIYPTDWRPLPPPPADKPTPDGGPAGHGVKGGER